MKYKTRYLVMINGVETYSSTNSAVAYRHRDLSNNFKHNGPYYVEKTNKRP